MKEKKIGAKYANMSPAKRFVHKNTGWLVLGAALILAVFWWQSNIIEQDFYYAWSCEMLQNYANGGATYQGKMYADLPNEIKLNYIELVDRECPMVIGNFTR